MPQPPPLQNASSPPGAVATPLVEVDALVKRYRKRGGEDVTAVAGVSFGVRRGEILGLLGPNGAGKSTTIKMICGLIRPDEGTVRVAGHDVRHDRRRVLARIAAVLEGNRNLRAAERRATARGLLGQY